jgi:hypothetical protein
MQTLLGRSGARKATFFLGWLASVLTFLDDVLFAGTPFEAMEVLMYQVGGGTPSGIELKIVRS